MRDMLEMGIKERTVTVSRIKLLETLRTNRDKHQAEYKETVAGYKVSVSKRLRSLLEKTKASLDENYARLQDKISRLDPEDEEPINDVITLVHAATIHLKVPRDHTHSYDVAIQMAEWEVNENVELLQSQFQCFVLDDWDWQQEFRATSKMYKG